MRIAIPTWAGRVSTVLDFARRVLLVDVHDGQEAHRSEVPLDDGSVYQRAGQLSRLGIDVLISGALSRPLAELVQAAGIRLVPFVTGPVDDVLTAYLEGRLMDGRFLLPGCGPTCRGGPRHRFRLRRGAQEARPEQPTEEA